jgi:hypothetical protein
MRWGWRRNESYDAAVFKGYGGMNQADMQVTRRVAHVAKSIYAK